MSTNNETLKQRIQRIFNLVVADLQKNFPQYWGFCEPIKMIFHNRKTNWGYYSKTKDVIGMSLYMNQKASDDHIEDTIRHEFAHAIQYKRDKFCDGHGSLWKSIAKQIGADDVATSGADVQKILPSKYVMLLDIGNGEWEYFDACHKKSKYQQLGQLKGIYPKGKPHLKNKLYMVTWAEFEEYQKEGMIASDK